MMDIDVNVHLKALQIELSTPLAPVANSIVSRFGITKSWSLPANERYVRVQPQLTRS